ncbi:hypothetical protein GCM10027291_15350 [Telluribacter humicola]
MGQWKLVAHEQTLNGVTQWVDVPNDQKNTLHFRYDGVVLNDKGLPKCCGPSALRIDGQHFKIEPKEPLPNNPDCALIFCGTCEEWNILVQGDEFIHSCPESQSGRSRYIRVK